MLNEDRIRLMVKAAEFEEQEGKEAFKINSYFREDYITLHMFKAGISGTCAYLILLFLWFASKMEEILGSLQNMDMISFGMGILKSYLIFLLVYEIIVFFNYYLKYTRIREQLKGYYLRLKEISDCYQEEENRLKSRDMTGGMQEDDYFI